ncbi:ABC transporter ATP-binding protein [Sporosarcina sp. NCCP-2222]|uniref:ABC transporter ATP-binding protein n=1 Tax=Sporosarcina sp. NCCP-2222 TaxID=2935073 RepID=UPI00207E035F|nr:ABC transporter ATP-binding protein [Sporosarcina sp. NCCP-2222]GKV54781.1 ABC transporter ATP-binding protein [Sporosarcina sp. NCCP-2222]
MDSSIISLQEVTYRRGEKVILNEIDWEAKQGEHWAILGLNGSGKTTLLNIIAAHHFPTEGEVVLLGNRFGETNLPELRKRIGFVSSSLERFSQMFLNETVERVIVSGKYASFGLYEQTTGGDWIRADELLSKFRLSYLKGKKISLLSEGERRRVFIARALMSHPLMLILDEPCSGLDILSREQFLQTLRTVVEANCHLVYVTHHIEEITEDITHVLLLKEGRIVASGRKEEILTGDLLSEAYSVPVTVGWQGGRPHLHVERSSVVQ